MMMRRGCECNRSTLDTIGAAGFDVVEVERTEMKNTPKFVRPLIVGPAEA